MYEPTTLMAVATGVSALTGVVSGIQQKRAADFNAEVREEEARAAEKKAKYDEDIHRERVKQFLSKQKAQIAKSGIELEGSPLLATLDTIEKGELDALAIRHGGRTSAQRSRSLAEQSRQQGRTALFGSVAGAGTTLLTGAQRIQRAA